MATQECIAFLSVRERSDSTPQTALCFQATHRTRCFRIRMPCILRGSSEAIHVGSRPVRVNCKAIYSAHTSEMAEPCGSAILLCKGDVVRTHLRGNLMPCFSQGLCRGGTFDELLATRKLQRSPLFALRERRSTVPSPAPSLNSLNFFTVGKEFWLFCFIKQFEKW